MTAPEGDVKVTVVVPSLIAKRFVYANTLESDTAGASLRRIEGLETDTANVRFCFGRGIALAPFPYVGTIVSLA